MNSERASRELKRRAKPREVVAPDFCVRNRSLRDRDGPLVAKIDCLAPSDAAVGTMQARISKELLPMPNRRRLRLPSLNENDGSVVLAVTVGTASVLLGADLLESDRPGLGWQVILDEYPRDGQRFGGFKIPHHGSITGHHPQAWDRLMSPAGWAAITPFNRQKVPLPNPDDCARILTMTNNAFITAPPGLSKLKHRDAAVQRTLQEAAIRIGPEPGKQGHIRFRKIADRASEKWTVELFGNAVPLSSLR